MLSAILLFLDNYSCYPDHQSVCFRTHKPHLHFAHHIIHYLCSSRRRGHFHSFASCYILLHVVQIGLDTLTRKDLLKAGVCSSCSSLISWKGKNYSFIWKSFAEAKCSSTGEIICLWQFHDFCVNLQLLYMKRTQAWIKNPELGPNSAKAKFESTRPTLVSSIAAWDSARSG